MTEALTVVLATANPGKASEIAAVLGDAVRLVPRPDSLPEVDEDADSLVGNARLKAVAIRDATWEATLADDTGLEVDALDGAPGVHSARFAGPDADPARNRRKLLAELVAAGATAPQDRGARFRTVLVLLRPDGSESVAEGVVEGAIAPEERGDGGFGYDSLFIPSDGDGRTFAQMSSDEKNAISHRGRALRELAAILTTPRSP